MSSIPILIEGAGANIYHASTYSEQSLEKKNALAICYNWETYYKLNASLNSQKTFKIHFLPTLNLGGFFDLNYYVILDDFQGTITSRFVYDSVGNLGQVEQNSSKIDVVFIPKSLGANVKVETISEGGDILDFNSGKITELQSQNGYSVGNDNYAFRMKPTANQPMDETIDLKMNVIVSGVSNSNFPRLRFYCCLGIEYDYDHYNEAPKDYSLSSFIPPEFYDCIESMIEIQQYSPYPIQKVISTSQPFCIKTNYGLVIEGEENDVYVLNSDGGCIPFTNVFALRPQEGAYYKIVRNTEATVNIYLLPTIEHYDLNYYFIFNNFNGYITSRYQMDHNNIVVTENSQTNADIAVIIGKNGCNIKVKEENGLLYPEDDHLTSVNGHSLVNESVITFAPIINFSNSENGMYDAKLKVQVTGQNLDKFPKCNFYFYNYEDVLFYSSTDRFISVEARDYSKGEKLYLSNDFSDCDATFHEYKDNDYMVEVTLNKSKNFICFKTKDAFLIEKRDINLVYAARSDYNQYSNSEKDVIAIAQRGLVYYKLNYTFPNEVNEIKFNIFFLPNLGDVDQHKYYIICDNFNGNITSRYVRDDCYNFMYDESQDNQSTYIDLVAVIGTQGANVKIEKLNNATKIIYMDDKTPNQFSFNNKGVSMFYPSNSSSEESLYDTKINVLVTGMNHQIFPHANFYLHLQSCLRYIDIKNDRPIDYSRGLRAFLPDEFDDCYSFDNYPEGEYNMISDDRGKYSVTEISFSDSDRVKCFTTYRSFLIEGRNTKITKGQKGNYTSVIEENALGVSTDSSTYYYRFEHSEGTIKIHFLPNKILHDEKYFVILGSFDGTITSKYDYTYGGLTISETHDIAVVVGSSGRTVRAQAGNGNTQIVGSDQEIINSLSAGDYTFSSDGLIDFTGMPFSSMSGSIIKTEIKVTVSGNALEGFPLVNFYLRYNEVVNYNVENQSPANYIASSNDTGLSSQQKMIIIIVSTVAGVLIIGILIFCIIHKKKNIAKEYTLGKTLGKGAFGQVRLGIHKPTKQVRAIKIMKKAKVNLEDLLSEITILSKLTHPSIMQIYEIFEDNVNIYIVSEYCKGGELFDIISKKGSFTEKEACIIMKQILSAVCYSHQRGIVHRDLKPENILMENTKGLSLKLIDWGCAAQLKKTRKITYN